MKKAIKSKVKEKVLFYCTYLLSYMYYIIYSIFTQYLLNIYFDFNTLTVIEVITNWQSNTTTFQ